MLCSTNAIESLNARYRRAVKARGHFPTEQAALKCLYLVTRSLDPTGTGRTRWAMRWKPALNAFAITFGDRFPAAETYYIQMPETPFVRQTRPALRSGHLCPYANHVSANLRTLATCRAKYIGEVLYR